MCGWVEATAAETGWWGEYSSERNREKENLRKVIEEPNYRGEKTQPIFRSNDGMAKLLLHWANIHSEKI